MADVFAPRHVLLRARHDPSPLDSKTWHDVIAAFTTRAFSDAQMAAFLMARVLHGITADEAVALTEAMLHSGTELHPPRMRGAIVDKHSTGGVGDTTTLIVAPLVASVGLVMAKLSGGSLGHTGGTLEKLASIPGMRTDLDSATFLAQLDDIGVAIAAATSELAPADRHLYALRDHIELVDDTALIAASIMSKKLATGANYLVLDVKLGQASLLQNDRRTRELATLCMAIGAAHQRTVTAVLSDMNQPLGPAIGNALEVRAAVNVLSGQSFGRLGELSVLLARELLQQTGVPENEAHDTLMHALTSGEALRRFAALVQSQGGDATVAHDPTAVLGLTDAQGVWSPHATGHVTAIDTRALGALARDLAGTYKDPRAGLELTCAVGMPSDAVTIFIHTNEHGGVEHAQNVLHEAIVFGDNDTPTPPLVQEILRNLADGDG